MTDFTQAIKELGYPITVSIWLMWFVSAVVVTRLQRLLEWALAVKHQLDHIEIMLQQITGATRSTHKEDENA
jgi:hypothetical protein